MNAMKKIKTTKGMCFHRVPLGASAKLTAMGYTVDVRKVLTAEQHKAQEMEFGNSAEDVKDCKGYESIMANIHGNTLRGMRERGEL